MKLRQASLLVVGLVAVLAISARALQSNAQDKDKKATEAAAWAPPKPTAEHAQIAQWVGNWDATVNTYDGGKAQTSKGTLACRSIGGLWVVGDFKGEMMGAPFEGHQIIGYDTAKKKFVNVWIDTMGTTLTLGESTYDPAAKTFTGIDETMMDGKPVRMTETTVWKDAKHRDVHDDGSGSGRQAGEDDGHRVQAPQVGRTYRDLCEGRARALSPLRFPARVRPSPSARRNQTPRARFSPRAARARPAAERPRRERVSFARAQRARSSARLSRSRRASATKSSKATTSCSRVPRRRTATVRSAASRSPAISMKGVWSSGLP
jgi:hypothetical protein